MVVTRFYCSLIPGSVSGDFMYIHMSSNYHVSCYYGMPKPAKYSGLDLRLDFMETLVGQASFPFHISQKYQPILVSISVEN